MILRRTKPLHSALLLTFVLQNKSRPKFVQIVVVNDSRRTQGPKFFQRM